MRFAKLFDLEDGKQVLLTLCYGMTEEEEEFSLKIETKIGTCMMIQLVAFETEKEVLQAMDMYDKETAEGFVKGIISTKD
jgi:hypothetical protein